jgi:RsiW-degrading membrane proteinase PrsW (M82 family)
MSTPPDSAPAPIDIDGFFQPRRAAFWLYLLLIAGGVHAVTLMTLTGFRVAPTTTLLGLAAWTLYTVPVLLFFRSLDLFEQYSKAGLALAFLWGGLGAVNLAIPANQAVFSLCAKLVSPEFSQAWGAAIAGPSDEEPLKLLGVVLLVLIARNQFRTVLSVMAFGAMAGLGFQVVEDFSYTLNGAFNSPSPDQVAPVVQMVIVRGIFCGLWSHTAYTAITAFGVGYFIVHRHQSFAKRLAVALAAFAFAWGLHSLWNSPLLAGLVPGPLGPLLLLPIKGGPAVLGLILLWRVARQEENAHLAQLAARFAPTDLVSPAELTAVGSFAERRRQRRALRATRGHAAARTLAKLQKAQLRLVMRYGRFGPEADVASLAQKIRDLRASLAAA